MSGARPGAGVGQSGDGHFSPIAALHAPTDRVLVLEFVDGWTLAELLEKPGDGSPPIDDDTQH